MFIPLQLMKAITLMSVTSYDDPLSIVRLKP
jgi:hypothetical protein